MFPSPTTDRNPAFEADSNDLEAERDAIVSTLPQTD